MCLKRQTFVSHGGQLLGYVSKVDIVCVNDLRDRWASAKKAISNNNDNKENSVYRGLLLTDVYKDPEHGQSRGVAQGSGQIGVDGFHVDDVHLETSGRGRK